jgi:putative ABC transport system permease protein
MRLTDLFAIAAESLTRTKSRSLLTILGIVIGIAAVILMLAIGKGAEGLILSEVADLGADLVFIEPSTSSDHATTPFVEQTVDLDDAKAMEDSGLFSAVSATLYSTVPVSFGESNEIVQVAGVDEDYLKLYPADLRFGSFIDSNDVDSYSKSAVVGLELANDLFGDKNPVGEKIKIKSKTFRVVGVFEEQGTRFFQNLDKQVTIPVTTMQRDVLGVDYVNFISALAIGDIETTKEDLRSLIRDSHDIENKKGDDSLDDFFVSSQTEATDTIGLIGSVLTILLSSIAAISLVVGGIGIMNIMLVSVTERTREIGLRKAVGATQREILGQFLIESVMLTLIGGVAGILIGAVFSAGIGLIVKTYYLSTWAIMIPPDAIALAAAVSTVVGLIFGIYPAKRAAKLNPIDALRYE